MPRVSVRQTILSFPRSLCTIWLVVTSADLDSTSNSQGTANEMSCNIRSALDYSLTIAIPFWILSSWTPSSALHSTWGLFQLSCSDVVTLVFCIPGSQQGSFRILGFYVDRWKSRNRWTIRNIWLEKWRQWSFSLSYTARWQYCFLKNSHQRFVGLQLGIGLDLSCLFYSIEAIYMYGVFSSRVTGITAKTLSLNFKIMVLISF